MAVQVLIGRDKSATIASNAALLLCGAGTSVLISRTLGPAGRGQYVTWQAWASAIGVAAFAGLPQVVVISDWSPRRHHFLDLAMPLSVTMVIGAIVALIVDIAGLLPGGALVGMFLVVAATQTGGVATAAAQRAGRMTGEFNVVRLLPLVVGLIAIGVLSLSSERTPSTWVAVIAAAQAAALTASLLFVTRSARTRSHRIADWRRTLTEAARLGPGMWITMFQYRADLLAVPLLFPSRVVGFYAVGVAAQSAVAAVGQVGGQHWFARGSPKDSTAGPASLRAELMQTLALASAVALVMGATAAWWVHALYGAAFSPATPLVVGMCVLAVLQSADYLLSHEMLLLGRGTQVPLYRLPATGVLLLGFALIAATDEGPLWIIACAALGYAISTAVMGLVALRRRPMHQLPALRG